MKRRKHSPEFKAQVVAEVRAGKSRAEVAREHRLASSMISKWIDKAGKPPRANGKTKALAIVPQVLASRSTLVWLTKAESAIVRGIRDGHIRSFDSDRLYTLLALQSLKGYE
jgi:transposase-like protein